jgi:hypothetical protein
MMTTHFYLVPRFRMDGAIHLLRPTLCFHGAGRHNFTFSLLPSSLSISVFHKRAAVISLSHGGWTAGVFVAADPVGTF